MEPVLTPETPAKELRESEYRTDDLWIMFKCCASSKEFAALNPSERSNVVETFRHLVEVLTKKT